MRGEHHCREVLHCGGRVLGVATGGGAQTFVRDTGTRVDGRYGYATRGGGWEGWDGEGGGGLGGDGGGLPGN